MRTIAVLGGVIGGVGLAMADSSGVPAEVGWVALGVLALTAALLGLRLVPRAPWWLRLVVGLGTAALAAAVFATVEGEVGSDPWRLVVGVTCVVVFLPIGLVMAGRSLAGRRTAGVHVPAPRSGESARVPGGARSRRHGAHSR